MCRKAFEDSILDISNCSVAASTPIPHKRQKKKKRKKTQLKLFFCLRRVYRLLFCLYICGMFKILEIILIKRISHNDLSQRAIEKIKMPGKQRSN